MKRKGLTEENILELPSLLKTMKVKEVVERLGSSESTILRWVKVLRERGIEIDIKRGRPRKLQELKD